MHQKTRYCDTQSELMIVPHPLAALLYVCVCHLQRGAESCLQVKGSRATQSSFRVSCFLEYL